MKKLVALIMIAFLVPAAASVAFAKNPCKDDRDKFCKEVKAAGKNVGDCLKEHSAELSEACKAHLAKPQEQRDKEKAANKAKKKAAGETATESKPADTAPAPSSTPDAGENKQ